ncbi:hypothetical protein Nepgr_006333 [Nepenthes gracilis]|uniref:Uncharacterized protein n=1 Tax=Nepenthes gracilis TaxID=150966 RepID=A0AAD3S4Y0_NEPGR|nr:hypothetical protein Nepgr_006333 [Nepenthes gracilis]
MKGPKIMNRGCNYCVLMHANCEVTRYDLRARLCWQDDEWVAIGKGYDISQDWRSNVPSNVRYTQNSGLLTVNGQVKDGCLVTRNISSIPESQAVPSRTLKRRFPFCDTSTESYAGPRRKMRVNEKENMDLQFISLQHSQLPEKGHSKRLALLPIVSLA